jgi:hypothetical protein
MDSSRPMLLISIMGPKTRKASRELLVKVEAKDRAKKESTVEQTATTAANNIIAKIELMVPCPKCKIHSLGMKT